jgi:glutathione synthase/RimK-type ligase-like ATP-grasp enzyme
LINFSINEHVEILAERIGAKCLVSSEVSHLANDKLKLKQFLEHSGLPTIEGVYTDDPDIIASYF